uniref:Uncharacterized protein n=1 Tax=Candidatus Kentrum sp. LPFa TaxID=2126335 RepID=A0A450WPZ8_9GAMM|nr:MAG: hypothetical protein BECKLPF1236B_GA0070989_11617 [Candidatus Kentron sp. LPFa]
MMCARAILDASRWGDCLLGDYSGVDVDGVTVSFGRGDQASAILGAIPVDAGATPTRVVLARYEDRALWDWSPFGERSLPNHPSLHTGSRIFYAAGIEDGVDPIHGWRTARA